jgi:hypothetical protein
MTNKILLFSLFLFIYSACHLVAQTDTYEITNIEYPAMPELYAEFPDKVEETSGLICDEESVWTFNDSGNDPVLYRIERPTGKIVQEVTVSNWINRDWEDITQDDNFIYIGDFGNNRGNRTDLKIYKIDRKKVNSENSNSIIADEIRFSYSDQQNFEIQNRSHNFDCESVVSFGDSLILFTKNWEDRKSRFYALPKTPGEYQISPFAIFNAKGLITGAAFNNQTGNLILIGYQDYIPFIYLFEEFAAKSLTGSKIFRINLHKMKGSQTEGICWANDKEVVISTEKNKGFNPSAYTLNVFKVLEQAGIREAKQ